MKGRSILAALAASLLSGAVWAQAALPVIELTAGFHRSPY